LSRYDNTSCSLDPGVVDFGTGDGQFRPKKITVAVLEYKLIDTIYGLLTAPNAIVPDASGERHPERLFQSRVPGTYLGQQPSKNRI
jgi:hypothetical protein